MTELEITNREKLHEEVYKKTEFFGRTQFIGLICDLLDRLYKVEEENISLEKEKKQLKEWLKEEINKLQEYGASFGLTIDEEIAEYIDSKIEPLEIILSKIEELEKGNSNE